MKLLIDPLPPLPVFRRELKMVISASEQGYPEVFIEDGLMRPDRHFLLGIAQTVGLALEEKDPEVAAFMETESITLEKGGRIKELPSGLVIARGEDGYLGVVAVRDSHVARRLARDVVRWFTSTVRLDIP